uniref:Glycosyltransferase n=1 Tax=Desulfovibrio sp. U5L TaxID=596152 RepID=I2Q317_9BACT
MMPPSASPAVADPLALADPTLAWLARCQVADPGYDQGGIRDPLDGRVVGDHYAATHFAWACALRQAVRPDAGRRDAALAAMAFHVRTSKDEYAPGTWSYHWDFNNLASIETYALLEGAAKAKPASLDEDWRGSLHIWKTNAHWAVNWVAMRALAHFRRHDLFGRRRDLLTARKWLEYVLDAQLPDGGIEDVKGRSLPSQYHAYTACLLHRMLARHPAVPQTVRSAALWLLAIIGPDGECNAFGRGQGQIFGYACAVYLFRAAAALDPELAPRCRWASAKVLERLARFQDPEGWWPLVLNRLPVASRAGWYDYHHQTVYNAFAALWLTLAAAIPLPPGPEEAPEPGVLWLRDSGLLAVRRKRWFALFAAGSQGAGYATEAGITPHQLVWEGHDLFRYPLGPGAGKYGEGARNQGQEANCWSPLWRDGDGPWQAPTGAAGTLVPGPGHNRWRLRLERDGAVWQRELVLGRRFLAARDTLTLPEAPAGAEPRTVRTRNFAWPAGRAKEIGPAFVRDLASGAVLRTFGDGALAPAGTVATAWDETDILAASGSGTRTVSGWRLRQGPARTGGKLPGIVCLSWDPWSSLWKRKQRLLFELSRSGRSPRTLYVEPPTSITDVIEGAGRFFRPAGDRLRRCLRSRPGHLGHGFHLASPLWPWPGQRTFDRLARANRQSWRNQLRRAVKDVGFPDGYILWLYHPSQVEALDVLGDGAELVVYDWTDDWPAALPESRGEAERRRLEERQHELLCRADVVFAVSTALARRAAELCPEVRHLPNATDPEVFRPFDPARPGHALAARRPVLVYLSQITERLDVDLVREMARERPQWTVVLAGPLACPPEVVAPLEKCDNVILAGALPYEEAAGLAAQADVCLLPHKEDALTRTLDPIKLYDYLATGRPIVSTEVAMHPALAGFVRVASGPKAFIRAVEAALAEPAGEADRRRAAAMAHTWAARATEAADLLERFFSEDG